MINRIVSFFILCLVLCIPLCVAYFHSGELMMRFVFFWPFFMSIMWIVGGVYFWVYRERHWPWGCLLYTSDAADESSRVDLG
ncbi:hypothetical protein KQJ25_31095, partial [Escherichia sp. S69_ASV_4]|nr:hypothetical protein [Escherichia sp. S69_ASV_4]